MSTPWHGYDYEPAPKPILDEIERLADAYRAATSVERHRLREQLTDALVYNDHHFPIGEHAGVTTTVRVAIHDLEQAVTWAAQHGFRAPMDRRKLRGRPARFFMPLLKDDPVNVPSGIASLLAGVRVSMEPTTNMS